MRVVRPNELLNLCSIGLLVFGCLCSALPSPATTLVARDMNTCLPLSWDRVSRGGATAIISDKDVSAFLNAVDLFGTGVFAFSGALTAGKKGMDLLGMVIIATVTSVGGGTVRDLLLDSGTVFWMRRTVYFKICAITAAATYWLWPTLETKMGWKDSAKAICVADAFGLGAFCVLGTQKAADLGLSPLMWVVTGVITSTFGGITRDVLCLQRPRAMYPYRSLYAAHPLLGSAVYTILTHTLGMTQPNAAVLSFLLTTTTRILSFDNPLRLPHWKGKMVVSSAKSN